ncbi:permease for cytosine/purines, uracil, thiamine, allantoin domain-containing protein [Trichoderma sp. SZMC 28013]
MQQSLSVPRPHLPPHLDIQSHAIDRKTADQKRLVKWHEELTMAFVWASGTNISGAVSAYCATFGATTGLRQISVSHFSFGWYLNKPLPYPTVSIIGVIIATTSLAISFLRLGYLLAHECYVWILNLTIYMIIFGMVGLYADNTTPSSIKGADLPGNMLSLSAIIYGSLSSWCTIVSDFYVYYLADVSLLKVFVLTILGIAVPTSIGMSAGAMVASTLNTQPSWKAAYTNPHEGLGLLIQDILHPRVFAKNLLVLFSYTGINTKIMTLYPATISFQQMARSLAKIPWFIWTIICLAVVLALAVAGRQKLNIYLQDFLSLLGYFRLPIGLAASVAFLLGAVAWCMGVIENWLAGLIGGLTGEFGGDVANELTFVITFIAYTPASYFEITYFGK